MAEKHAEMDELDLVMSDHGDPGKSPALRQMRRIDTHGGHLQGWGPALVWNLSSELHD